MEVRSYKTGWYKKGKSRRYLFFTQIEDGKEVISYQKQNDRIKRGRFLTRVNTEDDKWFAKAEYIGSELPEERSG